MKASAKVVNLLILILICFGPSSATAAAEGLAFADSDGYLVPADIRVLDSASALTATETLAPAEATLDFSAGGRLNLGKIRVGRQFKLAWSDKCPANSQSCSFQMRFLYNTTAPESTVAALPVLHLSFSGKDSGKSVSLATGLIIDGRTLKLEAIQKMRAGDSLVRCDTARRVGNFRKPKLCLGYDLRLTLLRGAGSQYFAVYCRPIGSRFKLPFFKTKIPPGFESDSLAFHVTGGQVPGKAAFSDLFVGGTVPQYLEPHEAAYLRTLAAGEFPGGDRNFDYFGEAVFKLIKTQEDSTGPYGTWDGYKERIKRMLNASNSRFLVPIQLVRTRFPEKRADNSVGETDFFLCSTPRKDVPRDIVDLFLDPAFLYGNGNIDGIRVTFEGISKKLALGEKLTIDFSDGREKRLELEANYKDGFKRSVAWVLKSK